MRLRLPAGLFMGAVLALGGCEALPTGDIGSILGDISANAPLTTAEIDAGLRQALEIGAGNVTGRLGREGGFFNDQAVRIPLPGRLGELQSELVKVNLSGPLDDLQTRMNAAASASMPKARELVVGAITSMTVEDAVGILRGGDTAATDYLRLRTQDELTAAFSPVFNDALAASGVFQTLDNVGSRYGLGAVTSDVRTDFTAHAVEFGLNGLFFYVAQEEQRIREEPVARTTELLRRVFGSR